MNISADQSMDALYTYSRKRKRFPLIGENLKIIVKRSEFFTENSINKFLIFQDYFAILAILEALSLQAILKV